MAMHTHFLVIFVSLYFVLSVLQSFSGMQPSEANRLYELRVSLEWQHRASGIIALSVSGAQD
jgi:hypothetical protein